MNIGNEEMKVSLLTLAVQCALMTTFALPLAAHAEEDEVDALKHPSNSVEFGALYSSQDSAKFGEYNGLDDEGFYGLGGFDVRGGPGYDGKDSGLRWRLDGANLGTTSRTLGGSVSDQGKWKVSIGYDELRHNITDTFQTPLQGKTGGNQFNLPEDFGTIDGTTNPSTRNLSPAQLGAFHTEKEYTTRRNAPFSASYTFTPQLSLQFDYNHLEQTGAKLIGTGSQGAVPLSGGTNPGFGFHEANTIIMNPTNYDTDSFNAALNWTGDKGHLTGGYYGSLFREGYNSLNWQTALASGQSTCQGAGCFVNNSMSTAPSNNLHQLNLSGGYNFTSATKLTGGFSYGYNKQDDSYAPTSIMQASGTPFDMMQPGGLPALGLNGQVETTHGDLKLTNQSIKDLTLSAGFKYNERDNRTDSNVYDYFNIGRSGSNANPRPTPYTGINTPYSNRKTQYEVAADYRLTKGQTLRLGYDRDHVRRWCNGVVGDAECVASPSSVEDKIGLTYRLKAFEDVNFNAGYSYATRNADFSQFYLANTGSYGEDENSQNKLGFVAYPYDSRKQHLMKTGVNWQATQKLDLGLNGRFSYDNYDATLGLQNGHSAGVNVDATYSYNENGSVSAYWSWQNRERDLRSGFDGTPAVAPAQIWTNQLSDTGNAVGLLTRHGGLLGGKLEIIGDFSYALDETSYSTQVPYLATCGNSNTLSCGTLPAIKNELLSFKLTGNYKVHKNGKVALAYIYQKLNSSDYFYNGQQYGFTPNRVMPNNLQEQDYTVNVVALSYIYNF